MTAPRIEQQDKDKKIDAPSSAEQPNGSQDATPPTLLFSYPYGSQEIDLSSDVNQSSYSDSSNLNSLSFYLRQSCNNQHSNH